MAVRSPSFSKDLAIGPHFARRQSSPCTDTTDLLPNRRGIHAYTDDASAWKCTTSASPNAAIVERKVWVGASRCLV